jgi:hypothetical protein
MDVEQFLQGVIRFSNFITSRLVVSGIVFYVLAGFMDVGSASEGFLPDIELVNQVTQNYQAIFDVLGVSDFALLLILFMFLTTIHILYVAFERVGEYLPPAIMPATGWMAIDDVIGSAFDTLRAARGEEHTEEENQRLYKFSEKLREIEQASEAKFAEDMKSTYAAYAISKSFVLFAAGAWFYAAGPAVYAGNANTLLIVLAIALLTALYAGVSVYRLNHARIAALRQEVIGQITEFSRIWASLEHQQRVAEICSPSRRVRPASLAIVIPVYGTLDALMNDVRHWRARRVQRRLPAASVDR